MIINLAAGATSAETVVDRFGFSVPTYLMVSGTGKLVVEIKGLDDVWRSFPETTFTAPTAHFLSLPNGAFRFKAEGGPLIVEMRL